MIIELLFEILQIVATNNHFLKTIIQGSVVIEGYFMFYIAFEFEI